MDVVALRKENVQVDFNSNQGTMSKTQGLRFTNISHVHIDLKRVV